MEESMAEHDIILEALRAGDANRAVETMKKHITIVGVRFNDLTYPILIRLFVKKTASYMLSQKNITPFPRLRFTWSCARLDKKAVVSIFIDERGSTKKIHPTGQEQDQCQTQMS